MTASSRVLAFAVATNVYIYVYNYYANDCLLEVHTFSVRLYCFLLWFSID